MQGMLVAIHIITVQLYGKLSALRVVYGQVPATTYTQVSAFRNHMYYPLVNRQILD